jgi:large subunit ribosomal protein L24
MLNDLKFHFPLQLKRWERKKCKPNGLPVLHKMHVRIGDTVQVIAGREKGNVGEVRHRFKHNSTVIVKDLNLKSKHKKGTDDKPGEIVMVSKISIELVFWALHVLIFSRAYM